MKRDDHLALAVYLSALPPQRLRDRRLRTAFYAGSVLPDSNPATYLRGMTRAKGPKGHDAQSSYALILRLLSDLRRTGVRTLRQAYRLGALFHYLADAFTYPHQPAFPGGIHAHNRYERDLHRVFGEALRAAGTGAAAPADPFRFLLTEQRQSGTGSHTPESDAAAIIRICSAFWRSVFQENARKSPISNKKG